MKSEVFNGAIATAYGKQLAKPVTFNGSYDAFESFDEIPDRERPSDSEILEFVNSRRKANARQKSMNEALIAAGETKPTLENNTDLQIKTMVKSLVASKKYDEEGALVVAKRVLGITD